MFNLISSVLVVHILVGLFSTAQLAQVFDAIKYGCIADGKHLNTEAIQKAINAANAAGGGTVQFPKGTYFTGPFHFKSNVHLELLDEAVIRFSDNFEEYIHLERAQSIHNIRFSALINADHVENIAITGNGTLDGGGEKWWNYRRHWKAEQRKKNSTSPSVNLDHHLVHNVSDLFDAQGNLVHDITPPKFFFPHYSKHITLEGVSFINSPFFTIIPTVCEYIKINRVTVKNPWDAPNTDGIDPDSCKHVTITNCFVSTGDDCLCVKSKQDNHVSIPSENITISDCVMHSGHGGFVIGSTTAGSIKNIRVSNMHFEGTDRGIRIKTARGHGGVIEDIHIANITMKNITREAITINAWYTDAPEEKVLTEKTPTIKDIFIQNVTGDSVLGIHILGLPERHFNNIQLKDVHTTAHFDVLAILVDNLTLTNVTTTLVK